jgi:hypothetical protein
MAPALVTLTIFGISGCVRRTITINTEPTGAIVHLNDEEIGPTPVSRDFTWYGDYDVIIRKPGFQTLFTHVETPRPWYQVPPIDFFADCLWPGHIHDQHEAFFELTPKGEISPETVISNAEEARRRTLFETD